jgi:rhamnogalacturonyl hydrolase YesR
MNRGKDRSIGVIAAAIIIWVTTFNGVQAQNEEVEEAEFNPFGSYDWESNMVIADQKRDDSGKLLPLQSYDETIRRGMSFLLDDHLDWFKGSKENLKDEDGNVQMPWVYYSNVQHNGEPFPSSIDRFVSYPALHHAGMIMAFVNYWKHSGNNQALEEAIKLADWNFKQSTPAEWAYGNMPYSTFEERKPGGFRDKSGVMPDKGAIMALAYLELYEASKEQRFLEFAEAIAHTLCERQRANGTWPFRVDPQTEEVIEEYTSSVIYAITLFEKLDTLHGKNFYKPYRDKTWSWLLNGPIKTKEFRGFYEDIPESTEGRTNADCIYLIRYLLAKRTDSNGYLELALELNAWIEATFMDKIEGFEPAEGIREQLQCNVVMGVHSVNWASMLYELGEASGNEEMKERALQTANYVTYYLQPDNRIVTGFWYHQWWYSAHIGVILFLFDFLEE